MLVAALMTSYCLAEYLNPAWRSVAAAGPIDVTGDTWLGRDSTIVKPVYIPTAPLPNRAAIQYTVAAGDTLDSIATDLKIPWREITWSNPNLKLPLKEGEVLPLPPVPGF